MQSTMISRVKKKISPKTRPECDKETTAAEIEKATNSFENISYPVMMIYLCDFIKRLMSYLKQTYISCTLKFPS